MKYYAVKVGKNTGIFTTWPECQENVHGFPGAEYKSFSNLEEAEAYMEKVSTKEVKSEPRADINLLFEEIDIKSDRKNERVLHAFIDGSNISEKGKHKNLQPTYGVLILHNNPLFDGTHELHASILSGSVKSMPGVTDITMSNQIAGELYSALRATAYAINANMEEIVLYYDYKGIEHWADNSWKSKNELSVSYNKTMTELMKKIKVTFVKVKGHDGIIYNDIVDVIAKAGKYFD